MCLESDWNFQSDSCAQGNIDRFPRYRKVADWKGFVRESNAQPDVCRMTNQPLVRNTAEYWGYRMVLSAILFGKRHDFCYRENG